MFNIVHVNLKPSISGERGSGDHVYEELFCQPHLAAPSQHCSFEFLVDQAHVCHCLVTVYVFLAVFVV